MIPGALAITVPKATYFSDKVADHIDGQGNLSQELTEKPYGPLTALRTTLADTVKYGIALKTVRENA